MPDSLYRRLKFGSPPASLPPKMRCNFNWTELLSRLSETGLMRYRTIYQLNFWNVKQPGKFQRRELWGFKVMPQDVPLWLADCFDLKTTLAIGSRETSVPPLTSWRTWMRGLVHKWLSEITSFHLSTGQDKPLFIKLLLFLSSCNDPLRPPGCITSSLTQDIL